MNAKEKAIELICKFDLFDLDKEKSIQCALIWVDEIINNDGFTQFDDYLTQYWNEVKQEIELLK